MADTHKGREHFFLWLAVALLLGLAVWNRLTINWNVGRVDNLAGCQAAPAQTAAH